MTDKFGMAEAIENLGIKAMNQGTATGLNWIESKGEIIESYSPVDGKLIGKVQAATQDTYEQVVQTASEAFKQWRLVPAPKRGEIVRQVGEALREHKNDLGNCLLYTSPSPRDGLLSRMPSSA